MSGVTEPWFVILGMALVTVLTRYAGYWVIDRYQPSSRTLAIMKAVPGSVLTAIIAPMVLATGLAETLAAIGILVIAWFMPTLVAIIGGVLIVIVLRGVLV